MSWKIAENLVLISIGLFPGICVGIATAMEYNVKLGLISGIGTAVGLYVLSRLMLRYLNGEFSKRDGSGS